MNEDFRKSKNVTKRELFYVATRLFQEKGYRGTSMQDIAQALGIQKASIYYYINSKEDLLREIMLASMRMLIKEGERILRSPLSPVEKLKDLISSHVKLICENLDLFTVSLREFIPNNAGSFWNEVVAQRDSYEAIVREIIRSGQTSGCFKERDVRLTGFALLGMMNWLIRWYSAEGEKSPAEIADLWQDIFLSGILCCSKDEDMSHGK